MASPPPPHTCARDCTVHLRVRRRWAGGDGRRRALISALRSSVTASAAAASAAASSSLLLAILVWAAFAMRVVLLPLRQSYGQPHYGRSHHVSNPATRVRRYPHDHPIVPTLYPVTRYHMVLQVPRARLKTPTRKALPVSDAHFSISRAISIVVVVVHLFKV